MLYPKCSTAYGYSVHHRALENRNQGTRLLVLIQISLLVQDLAYGHESGGFFERGGFFFLGFGFFFLKAEEMCKEHTHHKLKLCADNWREEEEAASFEQRGFSAQEMCTWAMPSKPSASSGQAAQGTDWNWFTCLLQQMGL